MFKGHLNIGKRLTIYGNNAMHWGVIFYTRKFGYVCFRLPFRSCGSWHPLYFYCSPNATPWAATFMLGRKAYPDDWALSRIRRSCFGHNFDENGWNITSVDYNYKLLDDDVSTEYEIKFREKGTLINRAIIEKGDDHNGN